MQPGMMPGYDESWPEPILPISERRTVHRVMGFCAAIALGSQVLLKLIAVLAEIVQQPRPVSDITQGGTAFSGKTARQIADCLQVIPQGMWNPKCVFTVGVIVIT